MGFNSGFKGLNLSVGHPFVNTLISHSKYLFCRTFVEAHINLFSKLYN